MSEKQWINVGSAPELSIRCGGSLLIQGQSENSLIGSGNFTLTDNQIESSETLRLVVPLRATVRVKDVAGTCKIKGVQGNVLIESCGGSVSVAAIGGAVTLGTIHGEAKVQNVGRLLTITHLESDLVARGVGGVVADTVQGDCQLQQIAGPVELQKVQGDCAVNGVSADLTLRDVGGDVVIKGIAGRVYLHGRDDVRVQGPLCAGKHELSADSTLSLSWNPDDPLTLLAIAPKINNQLPLENLQRQEGQLMGQLGDGSATVMLQAKERITLKGRSEEERKWSHDEAEFDFARLGEKLAAELSSKAQEVVEQIAPELNSRVETTLRSLQTSLERVISELENPKQRTQQPPSPPPPPPPSATATPKSAEPAPDRTAEQLRILRLLEQKLITIEEANVLLARL